MGEETQLSLPMGAQLLLPPVCCAEQYSVTTWEPREAKTHPLLQLLELCNRTRNLPCAPRYPRLAFPTPALVFLLPAANYLPFSVIASRPQGFHFPTESREQGCFSLAFSLELMVLFPVGCASSLPIHDL